MPHLNQSFPTCRKQGLVVLLSSCDRLFLNANVCYIYSTTPCLFSCLLPSFSVRFCPCISICTLSMCVGVLSLCTLLTGIQESRSIKPLPTSVPLKSYTPSPSFSLLSSSMVITGITSQHILNHAGAVLGRQVRSQWTVDLHRLLTSFISEQQFVLFLPQNLI